MILLDLDPNIVKPGWTPFLITMGLAAVIYLLFRSMRRQFRRVDAHFDVPEGRDAQVGPASPAEDGSPPDRDVAGAAVSVEGSPPPEGPHQ
jgi:hypothetical protein